MGILLNTRIKIFERMIINENHIGFTLHEVSKEIDKGDIIYKKKLKLIPKKIFSKLYKPIQ